ncbi:hypothetical protein MKW94_025012, partial [Papaver nudicaule]|nr:hypothetical protein [Papaver nudicaule]
MDKNSYTMSAFHECTSNRDNLCYDDIFPEETENKHEVLADNQGGYNIQCSKTKREKAKEEAPPEEELLVDFTGLQSENLLKSPLPASNLKDPLCERSATGVHQAGSLKQNGVRNTLLDELNATTDEHFSSITSDASFQTVPKYQLKEEKVPQIGQETHRLAILRLDLSQVPAVDLFGGMCYFLPVGAQIKSVAVYSTRKHVKEDGLVGLFDDKVDELHKVQMLPSEESRQ